MASAGSPTVHGTLRWAALASFSYAALVLANDVLVQDFREWYLALTWAAGFVAAGAGLLRRARWAWTLSLALGGFSLAVKGIDFALWLNYGTPWWDSMLPQMRIRTAAVAPALLVSLVLLLLHPRSRAAMRSTAV